MAWDGQTADRQIDALADVGKALGKALRQRLDDAQWLCAVYPDRA
jgi:hypothetical protein